MHPKISDTATAHPGDFVGYAIICKQKVLSVNPIIALYVLLWRLVSLVSMDLSTKVYAFRTNKRAVRIATRARVRQWESHFLHRAESGGPNPRELRLLGCTWLQMAGSGNVATTSTEAVVSVSHGMCSASKLGLCVFRALLRFLAFRS